MIRIICKVVNTCPEGAVVGHAYDTFDIDAPELEEYLNSNISYCMRTVVGAETLPQATPQSAKAK